MCVRVILGSVNSSSRRNENGSYSQVPPLNLNSETCDKRYVALIFNFIEFFNISKDKQTGMKIRMKY